jgi:NADH-quinone oxidoreductase subunit M
MILIYLIIILLAGAFFAWFTGTRNPVWPRIISISVLLIDLIIILIFVLQKTSTDKGWAAEIKLDWIPAFGISLHLALDGLSLVMIILTFFLGLISVISRDNMSISFSGSVSFLFLLGAHACSHVLYDWYLGT